MIYKADHVEVEGTKEWREEGNIQIPSVESPLTLPRGIAIHSPLNYFVICDKENHRILFFILLTRQFIRSYHIIIIIIIIKLLLLFSLV